MHTKFHLDGSEVSWLVYADWLEDQDIDATHIRNYTYNEYNDNEIVYIFSNEAVAERRPGDILSVMCDSVPGSGVVDHVGSYAYNMYGGVNHGVGGYDYDLISGRAGSRHSQGNIVGAWLW